MRSDGAATASARLAVGAIVALSAFLVLGVLVSHGAPGPVDRWAAAFFFGQATPLAAALTVAGTFPYYVGLCLAVLIAGFVRREWLPRTLVSVVTVVVAWQASDLFKEFFHRSRPEHMLAFVETSYSYASGHAALAMAFWGVWAAYAFAALPRSTLRTAVVTAIALWVIGIGWSRLALGAHYLSDVAGGYALGLASVCVAIAVARRLQPRTATSA